MPSANPLIPPDLVKRLRSGDVDALTSLYSIYYDRLTRYAYQFVRDSDSAQALAQDLFVTIWENREILDVRGDWEAYLFRALRNRALTLLRDNTRHDRLLHAKMEDTGDVFAMGDQTLSPDDILEQSERQHRMAITIENLPPRQREALTLRWGSQLTYAAIGQVMGITEIRARQLFLRATTTLGEVLRSYEKDG